MALLVFMKLVYEKNGGSYLRWGFQTENSGESSSSQGRDVCGPQFPQHKLMGNEQNPVKKATQERSDG